MSRSKALEVEGDVAIPGRPHGGDDLVGGDGRIARRAAWWYEQPTPAFTELLDHVALYPGRVDRITVDGEEGVPEAGDFYGGWVTSRVTLEHGGSYDSSRSPSRSTSTPKSRSHWMARSMSS